MNVTSLTVNITSLSLTLASNNAPASSAPTPSVETNASQDRGQPLIAVVESSDRIG
jgi:hypothetical protein